MPDVGQLVLPPIDLSRALPGTTAALQSFEQAFGLTPGVGVVSPYYQAASGAPMPGQGVPADRTKLYVAAGVAGLALILLMAPPRRR